MDRLVGTVRGNLGIGAGPARCAAPLTKRTNKAIEPFWRALAFTNKTKPSFCALVGAGARTRTVPTSLSLFPSSVWGGSLVSPDEDYI